ncbi:MAG: aminoacyl-tRNA hydrolase [Clostridia bacterium]|nr:aminoacyl-tRNA hydrolase [Clostridia bacterium]
MYLIVGLGNPESEYANTRHNMGFNAINQIAKEFNIEVNKTKFKGLYGTGIIKGEKVILLKPQTYMNLSGEAVIDFMDYYKLDLKNLIIIYDDVEIEPGLIRIRKKGSSGSHNGMKSIVEMLQSEEFTRIRIGIGKPDYSNDMINYVIGHITDEEIKKLEPGVEKAKLATIEIIENGIDNAMNKYNAKKKEV